MAERKYTHGLSLRTQHDVVILSIGDMEIWDGADLSLVRDTLHRLIHDEGVHAVGVDMAQVQYVPSGFFGMLFDWYERGVEVRLYQPRGRVINMLWFRKFFQCVAKDVYRLVDGGGINEDDGEELWEQVPSESNQDETLVPV